LVVWRLNLSDAAIRSLYPDETAARRCSGASFSAQYADGRGRSCPNDTLTANRARLDGGERFIELAAQSAFAGAAFPQSQAAYAGA
jgi:hypothetical protein